MLVSSADQTTSLKESCVVIFSRGANNHYCLVAYPAATSQRALMMMLDKITQAILDGLQSLYERVGCIGSKNGMNINR